MVEPKNVFIPVHPFSTARSRKHTKQPAWNMVYSDLPKLPKYSKPYSCLRPWHSEKNLAVLLQKTQNSELFILLTSSYLRHMIASCGRETRNQLHLFTFDVGELEAFAKVLEEVHCYDSLRPPELRHPARSTAPALSTLRGRHRWT